MRKERKVRGVQLTLALGIGLAAVGFFYIQPWRNSGLQQQKEQPNSTAENNPSSSHQAPGVAKTPSRGDSSGLVQSALDVTLAALTGNSPDTAESRAELIRVLNDPAQPLKARRQAARLLARSNSPAAVTALVESLTNAPPYLKAAIGESLGEIALPQARRALLDLLRDSDDVAVRGAIRGLAAQGGLETVDVLETLLRDATKSESVRTEAALALGDIPDPNAFRALALAAMEMDNETVRLHALQGIGQRPLSETGQYLRGILDTPETSQEIRTEILEALSESSENPHPFLIDYIDHADPEVRAAAALAMSQAGFEGQAGSELLARLNEETDPNVRLRLYQALGNQDAYDIHQGMALANAELNPQIRLEGYRILASGLRRDASPDLLNQFDQQAVPFLVDTALQDQRLHARLTSVMALSQAKTPQSMAALEQITRSAADPKVVEAAQIGLR